jgi:hypothetical protein
MPQKAAKTRRFSREKSMFFTDRIFGVSGFGEAKAVLLAETTYPDSCRNRIRCR